MGYAFDAEHSGIGVIDKTVSILASIAEEPRSLAELVAVTGVPRATAHRLAMALLAHRLLARDGAGRFMLGSRLGELASAVPDPLIAAAGPVLEQLRDEVGESVQLYRVEDQQRVCIAVADRGAGLRTTVPVGSRLPLTAGSGAQVLCAWRTDPGLADVLAEAQFTERTLAAVRRRGWAQSIAEREAGVASVSAPVRGAAGTVIAALSVSGPIERLGRAPGPRIASTLVAASRALSVRLRD